MQLIGSNTSPYARRLRLLLADHPYQFVNLDIYVADRDELRRHNPAMRVPMLHDGDQPIYDSRVIFRYLSQKLGLPPLSWDEENLLTLIDAANDSLVILLQAQRSGLEPTQDALFFNLQRERIAITLTELSRQVEAGRFTEWRYPAICLYCLWDWAAFRQLPYIQGFDTLRRFWEQNKDQSKVTETDPRG